MISVDVAGVLVKSPDNIKLLDAMLDNKLALTGHVNAVCKATFFHIRTLRHVWSVLTEDTAKTVACARVGSRLDYANSILYGREHPQTATYAKHHRPGCQALEKQYGRDGHT